jgi:hypothetical protein
MNQLETQMHLQTEDPVILLDRILELLQTEDPIETLRGHAQRALQCIEIEKQWKAKMRQGGRRDEESGVDENDLWIFQPENEPQSQLDDFIKLYKA